MRQTLRFLAVILVVGLAGVSGALAKSPPQPEIIESDEFYGVLARSGDLYIAGQPTEAGLADLAANGVTTVINLRRDVEMADPMNVPFDEAAILAGANVNYVRIPLGGMTHPYDPEALEQFAQAMEAAEGETVLLHCTSAYRASHIWAAWLVKYQDVPLAAAVEMAQAVNLGSTQSMRKLPIEGFLEIDLEAELAD